MKTINKIIKGMKIATTSLAVGGLYCLTLMGVQRISYFNSPIIENQNQLEQILETEKRRAGIKEDMNIHVKISKNEREVSYAGKICKKEYKIGLSPNPSLSLLRHELYHVAGGHCDEKYNLLKYLFINEPQATIYQITGLKP